MRRTPSRYVVSVRQWGTGADGHRWYGGRYGGRELGRGIGLGDRARIWQGDRASIDWWTGQVLAGTEEWTVMGQKGIEWVWCR